jgi:hypothetical protein
MEVSGQFIVPVAYTEGKCYCYPMDKRLRSPKSLYVRYGLDRILASVGYLTPGSQVHVPSLSRTGVTAGRELLN